MKKLPSRPNPNGLTFESAHVDAFIAKKWKSELTRSAILLSRTSYSNIQRLVFPGNWMNRMKHLSECRYRHSYKSLMQFAYNYGHR